MTTETPIRRALRAQQVAEKVGAGVSTIRAWVAEGKFPAPKEISSRFKIWWDDEVNQWLEKHPRKVVNNV
jgi:excisionase family DNA binding protein